jgi:hypothetical protein
MCAVTYDYGKHVQAVVLTHTHVHTTHNGAKAYWTVAMSCFLLEAEKAL